MKKPKKQARRQRPRPVVAKVVVIEQPMDMDSLRGHISNLVCAGAVDMVKTTVGRVKTGQYQAMKYLFEMIGLFPATAVPQAPQEDSLAEMLLGRLGIQNEIPGEREPADHVE